MSYTTSLELTRNITEYRRILEDVVDLHVHLAPDVAERSNDDIEFARVAEKVGYKAFLIKNHNLITADRAWIVSKLFERIKVFGGIVLNSYVGGLNPEAVETAILLGAKQVWMPTLNAANHINYFGEAALPTLKRVKELKSKRARKIKISIFDENGKILEEVKEILELIAEADIILGTGHLSLAEIFELVKEARRAGVRKILVTHPEFKATKIPLEDQVKLADMGAYMEHCAVAGYEPRELAENIKRVGVDKCVLSSDAGQPKKGHPIDVMYKLVTDLLEQGVTDEEIRRMTVENPSRLLSLED
ncbi:MAG TPA: hypothetical protein EYH45_07150 [Candidatus Caldiarchaeum subterraneum]|uniref:Cytosolic protein n=1 Tax=Caldiarchaeum subterraneum TaxID=311458 RepID=A0A832ZWT9_CALS0|nr:hypothetical protein [Candidatus Caldarchaeum subterraneum]